MTPKPKLPRRWPQSVTSGSVTVRVYRERHATNASGFAYVLAWHAPDGRKRKKFANPAEALAEARIKADQLAAGRLEGAELSIAERDEYVAAKREAGGESLVGILKAWKQAQELAGADVLKACQFWAERHGLAPLKPTTVAAAVASFLKAKRADNVNTKAGYERTLPAFVAALGDQPIASLTPDQIAHYLQRFKNAGSKNSHHKRITSLFRWCRKRGLLPLDILTAPERVDRARAHRTEIGLVTVEQSRAVFALLEDQAPQYVPALAIAALCGLRRSEVHGQRWEDIDLGRMILRVSAAKPNTPARRLVPIPDAAVEWLVPYREKKGFVCPLPAIRQKRQKELKPTLVIDRIRDLCRTSGLDLADNGFRHTWISARVEITGDIPRTSLEAGNTPAIIHRHYRELIRREEAEAWFDVRPMLRSGAPVVSIEETGS